MFLLGWEGDVGSRHLLWCTTYKLSTGWIKQENISLPREVPGLFNQWQKLTWAAVFEAWTVDLPFAMLPFFVPADTNMDFFLDLSSILPGHSCVPTFMYMLVYGL